MKTSDRKRINELTKILNSLTGSQVDSFNGEATDLLELRNSIEDLMDKHIKHRGFMEQVTKAILEQDLKQ